jgi:acetyl esterase/lipase
MKHGWIILTVFASLSAAGAQSINRDVPYAQPANGKQSLDIFAPAGAHNLPVVFWIHGGGWQIGDKSDVKTKPQAFMDKGFVFVSINYRLVPTVDMTTLTRDVAKAFRWVQDHIAEHGGDPTRVLVAGHSAGAQLSALLCTDERYLKAEGLGFEHIKGCVPVDGDTFDLPAIIETTETRRRVHGQPQAKYSDRQKFGDDPEKFRDFSAVNHVARGKGIPPFLLLHVADHPDTSIQARHFAEILKAAAVPVTVFAAPETNHMKLNDHLGLPDDPATKALFDFVAHVMPKK